MSGQAGIAAETRQQQKQQGAQLSEVSGNLGELGFIIFCCCRVAANASRPIFYASRICRLKERNPQPIFAA
jgi:hypothetical protein